MTAMMEAATDFVVLPSIQFPNLQQLFTDRRWTFLTKGSYEIGTVVEIKFNFGFSVSYLTK